MLKNKAKHEIINVYALTLILMVLYLLKTLR